MIYVCCTSKITNSIQLKPISPNWTCPQLRFFSSVVPSCRIHSFNLRWTGLRNPVNIAHWIKFILHNIYYTYAFKNTYTYIYFKKVIPIYIHMIICISTYYFMRICRCSSPSLPISGWFSHVLPFSRRRLRWVPAFHRGRWDHIGNLWRWGQGGPEAWDPQNGKNRISTAKVSFLTCVYIIVCFKNHLSKMTYISYTVYTYTHYI